jgi:hypothetical protein
VVNYHIFYQIKKIFIGWSFNKVLFRYLNMSILATGGKITISKTPTPLNQSSRHESTIKVLNSMSNSQESENQSVSSLCKPFLK